MKILLMIVMLLVAGVAHAEKGAQYEATVQGMVCDFCAQGLKKMFSKEDAVAGIDVSLENKRVLITFNPGQSLSRERIGEIITGNGLTMMGLKNTACPSADSLTC